MTQETHTPTSTQAGLSEPALARLTSGHAQFIRFLRPRLPRAEDAEEILQQAYLRALERGGAIRDAEAVNAWFYRLLRNAVVDFYRARAREQSLVNDAQVEQTTQGEAEDETLEHVACQCVSALLDTLTPAHADILRRVDVQGAPVVEVAGQLGISSSNAGVRLHRARKALSKELIACCGACATDGCGECECGPDKLLPTQVG